MLFFLLFHQIHVLVGHVDGVGKFIRGAGAEKVIADAGAELVWQGGGLIKRLNSRLQIGKILFCVFLGGVGGDHEKFVAPVAGDSLAVAAEFFENVSKLTNTAVAFVVAIGVVDVFKPVHVHKQ
jgi:hypothetical protein